MSQGVRGCRVLGVQVPGVPEVSGVLGSQDWVPIFYHAIRKSSIFQDDAKSHMAQDFDRRCISALTYLL